MPRHDWKCSSCGAVSEDLVHSVSEIPDHVECSCGKPMQIYYGDGFSFNNHWSDNRHNRMYGKEYHHGFGCVVESYEHKQQLLKEYEVSEAADPVNGSRSWRDQAQNKQSKNPDTAGAIEMTQEQFDSWNRENG